MDVVRCEVKASKVLLSENGGLVDDFLRNAIDGAIANRFKKEQIKDIIYGLAETIEGNQDNEFVAIIHIAAMVYLN